MSVRVLVVDDAQSMRVLVRRLLEADDAGFVVVAEAGSRSEALERFDEVNPDLVLLDLNLNGDDGFEVAVELLRRDEHARVVLLTGAPTPDVQRAAAAAGVAGVLSKASLPGLSQQLLGLDEIRDGGPPPR